jgi:carboxymethylenebutenolidase
MNYFQRYLAEEFAEDYQEGHISRRDALKLIATVTGSLVLANSFLAACMPREKAETSPVAATVPAPAATDTALPGGSPVEQPTESPAQAAQGQIEAADIDFPGQGATLVGHLARPAGDGSFPVVLVCHENRGLTDHIRDVTARLAKAGYVALAVDLLSRQGGTASKSYDEVPGLLGNTPPDQFVQDFRSGWDYLKTLPIAKADRVGMVGFCFGGGVTWLVATAMPELKAAVPFYGPHPPLDKVPNIQAAVLAIYGELDQRINQGIPAIEAAMKEHNKIFEKIIYPNADHAFHNDTSPRYNAEAAKAAWKETLDWFALYLK